MKGINNLRMKENTIYVQYYCLKNPVSVCEPLSKYWAIDFHAEMSACIHNIF